jgi:preprotein translocase subunit YajC
MQSFLALTVQETPAQTPAPGDPAGQPTGGFGSFLPFILIGLVFYFVLIAPERKNRKKRNLMLADMKKGDKVMTSSGMYGSVTQIQDDVVTLQVADGVRLRFSREAIQTIVDPKEEAKD